MIETWKNGQIQHLLPNKEEAYRDIFWHFLANGRNKIVEGGKTAAKLFRLSSCRLAGSNDRSTHSDGADHKNRKRFGLEKIDGIEN